MNVLLCGQWPEAEAQAWHAALSRAAPDVAWLNDEQAAAQAHNIEAAVVANPAPGSLSAYPNLRLIQSLWAGVDRLLADPSVPQHVPIARMVDPALTAAMVETALWATLALHRGFFTYATQQRQQHWQPLAQRRAAEVNVAVLGLGVLGSAVARCLAAQGYAVAGWAQQAKPRPGLLNAVSHSVSGLAALPGLLARSQIVINLLPLTPATRGLINSTFLSHLPRGAGLVNLARGAHVVDADLLAALHSGQLAHAVLDVFHTEPLPASHPYWSHPQVTVLPHAAALTDERSAAAVVAANLRALAHGAPLQHLVLRALGY